MIQAIELQVISKILATDDDETIDTLMTYSPDLYFSAYKKEIEFIHHQKDTYGIIPSVFDFQAQFPEFNIVGVPEPLSYLTTRLKEYRAYLILIETFNKVKDLQDGDVKDAWRYIGTQYDKATMLEESQPMDIVKDAKTRAEQIQEYSKQQRIPTGFEEIDRVMYGGLSTVEELVVLIARTNAGKAQPLWAPVLTPDGWTTMGDLKIGDVVVGKDNDNGKVVHIFPQGEKDYYRVTFNDGTTAECCDDHLWVVSDPDQRANGTESVLTLKEIRDTIDRDYAVPLSNAIQFSSRFIDSNNDSIVEDVGNRRLILADFLETSIDALYNLDNRFTFYSSDDQEIKDVCELARSLGFWALLEDDGVSIQKRKFKHIDRIEYVGRTECQCILLDNQSHTYLTSDYTVTHNSWVCTKMMESAQKNKFPVAYYSPEMQAAYLGTRFDTWRGHFENNKLFRGDYSQEYYAYLKSLEGEDTSAFVIEDKDFPDGVSIRTLEPFVKKHGIKLLIIDGISYMQDDHKATRDQEKYKNIAMGLFTLSKKYGCACVLVMQANREVKSKDDKGETVPTLYNAEGSDQPARIATQAFGIRQIFDKHVLDIGLLKSRMADNRTPVFSYAWDINTGQTQYIPGDDDLGAAGGTIPPPASPSPQISTSSFSFGTAQPDSNDLSLLDASEDDLIEF